VLRRPSSHPQYSSPIPHFSPILFPSTSPLHAKFTIIRTNLPIPIIELHIQDINATILVILSCARIRHVEQPAEGDEIAASPKQETSGMRKRRDWGEVRGEEREGRRRM
jgi:hypothetical protein